MSQLPSLITELCQGKAPSGIIMDALKEKMPNGISVYVVMGCTPSYNVVAYQWIAANRAYLMREDAERAADNLNKWCKEHRFHSSQTNRAQLEEYRVASAWGSGTGVSTCPHDPQFCCDYRGTEYEVKEIILILWQQ